MFISGQKYSVTTCSVVIYWPTHTAAYQSRPKDGRAGEMAECARQLVLEPYLVLLNDGRSSSHYVRSLKIFLNSFSALINRLPSCFVLCLSSCVCLTRLILLTFGYCAFDMIQLKRYLYILLLW